MSLSASHPPHHLVAAAAAPAAKTRDLSQDDLVTRLEMTGVLKMLSKELESHKRANVQLARHILHSKEDNAATKTELVDVHNRIFDMELLLREMMTTIQCIESKLATAPGGGFGNAAEDDAVVFDEMTQ